MKSITIKPCVNPITSTAGGCSNGRRRLSRGGYGPGAVEEISSFARVDNTKKGTHPNAFSFINAKNHTMKLVL